MTACGERGLVAALAVLLAGCAATPTPPVTSPAVEAHAPACGHASEAPLLEAALRGSGLRRPQLGIGAASLRHSPYHGGEALADPRRPPLLNIAFDDPWRLGCAHDALTTRLDRAADGATPGADLLEAAAATLDQAPGPAPSTAAAAGLEAALATLCQGRCARRLGEPGEALAAALGPVLAAVSEVVIAREARYRAAGLAPSIAWDTAPGDVYRVMFGPALLPPFAAPATRALLDGPAARRFHAAGIALARTVEQARLQRFAGLHGVDFEVATPLGRVRVSDAADHLHDDRDGPFLLLLDLGGNDRYLGAAAATRPGVPVSVLVDLAGDDRYGYPASPVPPPHALLLADDGHGRAAEGPPRTRSVQSRQAAARDGVALLFDFGGDDRYRSLAQSQGYAALGVALLLDASGDDVYEAELLAQGVAVQGVAVAADLGEGDDQRLAFSGAQGFAHYGGAALLYDDGGDDRYTCPTGAVAHGGVLLYPSSQLPARGNLSFCQGAGFGIRADAARLWRAGGVGVLRDRGGDDRYVASVYAQGVGYWQGAGVLADGGGDDRYDGDWYVQGAAAHYGLGLLADAAGDDVYGGGWPVTQMQAGAGHDFAVGVLLEESGDDRYRLAPLSAGASNCNGLGVLVDNAGDDVYEAASELTLGLGGVGPECRPRREAARSIGIMLDAGGRDRYVTPGGERPLPGDDARFGHARDGLATEVGIGVDGRGGSGLHVAPPGPRTHRVRP